MYLLILVFFQSYLSLTSNSLSYMPVIIIKENKLLHLFLPKDLCNRKRFDTRNILKKPFIGIFRCILQSSCFGKHPSWRPFCGKMLGCLSAALLKELTYIFLRISQIFLRIITFQNSSERLLQISQE